jgi:hypothetical protein
MKIRTLYVDLLGSGVRWQGTHHRKQVQLIKSWWAAHCVALQEQQKHASEATSDVKTIREIVPYERPG